MTNAIRYHLMLAALTGSCLFASVCYGDAGLTIEPVERWHCYFGDRTVSLNYNITSNLTDRLSVNWMVAIQNQIVARRTTIIVATQDQTARLAIEVKLPSVRPNIVVPVTVSLTVNQHHHSDELSIFPDNPFADRREALAKLGIHLFDPDRKTSAVFTKSGIPFDNIVQVDQLASIQDGLLVLGEGISFREFRSLSKLLNELLIRGVRVLCLAPKDCLLPAPANHQGVTLRSTSFTFSDSSILHQFDKRYDRDVWPPDGRVIASRHEIVRDRAGLVLQTANGYSGWPWFRADYETHNSRLIVCGFAIVESWDATPVPRYFLADILKSLEPPQ